MSKDPLDGDWELSRLYQELGLSSTNVPGDLSQPGASRRQPQYGQARRTSGRRSLAEPDRKSVV